MSADVTCALPPCGRRVPRGHGRLVLWHCACDSLISNIPLSEFSFSNMMGYSTVWMQLGIFDVA